MASWLFDDDPAARSRELFHEDGDGWVIEKRQVADPILAENTAHLNEWNDYRPFADREGVRIASVPVVVVEDMIRKHGKGWLRDHKAVLRWLNDPDQRAFRTAPGTFL